jgi:mRNA interferase RelE/StbE
VKIYIVSFSAESKKFLKKLDHATRLRVTASIEQLETNPRPHGVKKLVGRNGWRLRVGDYRVVYTIQDNRLLVMIIRVAHRKDVYR